MRRMPYITVGLVALGVVSLPMTIGARVTSPEAMEQRGESFEQRAQTTVGGSKYFVQGRITSKEGNTYWVMQPSGDEVRLRTTARTYAEPWVNTIVGEFKKRSSFQDAIQVDAQTGEVWTDKPLPGHPILLYKLHARSYLTT